MNRALGALLLIGLLLVAGAYIASPVYAFSQLKDAARTGDRDRLEALVDFPALRENLKQQVDSKAVKAARGASGISYPVVAILGRIGAALGDKAVDKLVTAQSISAMVTLGEARHGHKPKANDASNDAPNDADVSGDKNSSKDKETGTSPTSPPAEDVSLPKVETRYAYLTPDRFRVSVAPASHPDVPLALIMDRKGLFSWRVEAIELPGK